MVWESAKDFYHHVKKNQSAAQKVMVSVLHVDLHTSRVHDFRVVLEVDDCNTFFPGFAS